MQSKFDIIRRIFLLGLIIGAGGSLGVHAADALRANRAVVQIAHIGASQLPFRFGNIQPSISTTSTDPLVSDRLAQIQSTYRIDGQAHGALALAGAYLANGEPAQVEQLLQSNDTLLARYFKAVACYWRASSKCDLRDPVVAKAFNESGLSLWLAHQYDEGFYQLLLAEQLDGTVSKDKALAYTILSAGANTILNDRIQAIRWAQLRVQVEPDDREGYLSLAALYLSAGQYESARTVLRIAEPLGVQSQWRFDSLMGQTAWALNDRAGALERYFQAYQLNPSETINAWYLGSALTAIGRGKEACPYLVAVAHTDRSQPYDRYLAEAADGLLSQIGTCSR